LDKNSKWNFTFEETQKIFNFSDWIH
jgi:hypothetical protein